MGTMENPEDLTQKVVQGNAPPNEIHAAYDQVAKTAPQASLADGLAHAFKSDRTPPFEQMVAGLFRNSNPDQKAGLLNRLLGALGPRGVTQALGTSGAAAAGAAGTLAAGNVTQEQAQQVPTETVQTLAQAAAKQDPSIMDQAAGFYAQHPQLVKAIGVGALALLVSKITSARH